MSCLNKIKFASRGEAKRHTRDVGGAKLTPYHCGLCAAWHLTSVKKRQHKSYTINRARDARRGGGS